MRIMFVLGSMGKGGAERVIANLSNNLISRHEISIITTSSQKSMYKIDDRIILLSLDKTKKKKRIVARTIARVLELRKIIKRINPDIIVSLLPEPTFRLMIAKTCLNKKTIISVRNDPNKEYNTVTKKLLVQALYTKANGFIFQTEDAKKWFSKTIQRKSVVIPNPINEEFMNSTFKGKKEKTIINVGRLSNQKNQKFLIDAFSQVHEKHPDYSLKIYGMGPLYDDLKNQIKKIKLENSISLMGEVENIKNEMQKAAIFVLSSNYEGMPNALMEAMALGLPCISSDCPCGGPKFLIENHKNGILYKINDKQGLINSINYIIENHNEAKRMGDSATLIRKKLEPAVINKSWEDYILKVYGEK